MLQGPRFQRALTLLLLIGIAAAADGAPADEWARGVDLDRTVARREDPFRLRWFFSPAVPADAESALSAGLAGVERIAVLSMFDDRWILEADADSAQSVAAGWGALGTLQADESGRAALNEATVLVGASDDFYFAEDLFGDVTSTVAFLDSGCDTAHDDLGDPDEDDEDGFPDAGDEADWQDATDLLSGDLDVRVVGWHDVTDDLPLAVGPWDDHYHGTAMASAGFGGGKLNPDYNGVAPEGRFVVVKTWNFEGRWERWASDFFLGVEWLLANASRLRVQAAVVGTVWEEDHGFGPAVDALADAGILLIAPVGNDMPAAGWPARVPETLGVGASTRDGRVAAYSARAPTLQSPPVLDLVAPGGSLLDAGGGVVVADNEPNDTYRARTGTSIAAAMVGGAVSVIAEAARESGHPWPEGRARVSWLTDLINATCYELAAAEPGGPGTPSRDRGGFDWHEGHGLLQVDAASRAVNNLIWPGDRADFELTDPTLGVAVWAARLPVPADAPLTFSLIPASSVDVDLFVYHDTGASLQLLGASNQPGTGTPETVGVERPPRGEIVVVARRVSGSGDVIFTSLQSFGPSTLWPRTLRSRQTSSPVAADLDGDGTEEIILTNSFAVDRRIHEFVVFDARGRTYPFFPRSVDSSPNFGALTAPVVGNVGGRTLLVAGSSFGRAFAVSDSAQVVFSTLLTSQVAISAPLLYHEGPGARLLFGSQAGIQVVDGTGQVLDVLPLDDAVRGELAAGDLDGDGTDEIVAMSKSGFLFAVELEGSVLAGFPVFIGPESGSPVLLGDGETPGVERILVTDRTGAGDMRIHDLDVSGTHAAGSPFVLPRSQLPLDGVSGLAVARPRGAGAIAVVGAVIGSFSGNQIYRLWEYRPEQGTVDFRDQVFSNQHLQAMLQFSRGLVLDEPRIADLQGTPGLEILQTTLFDWSEAFVGNPRRYGSARRIHVWPADGKPDAIRLGPGHEEFPAVWGKTPLISDLDADGYPDFVVLRDQAVFRSGSRMRWTLDGMWAAERNGRTREACQACDGPTFVAAPPAVRDLRLTVSPNPFNPRTSLLAEMPAAGRVDWSVFDSRGRRVRTWTEEIAGAGVHRSLFEAVDQRGAPLASGVYFVRVEQLGRKATARMVLLR